MGHEGETLEGAPKSPADHPDVATGDALMGHEESDQIGSEKQTKDKGTVIAEGNDESKVSNSQQEAFRVAGRMLESGIIKASELQTKVSELAQYEPSLIKNYEKATFANVDSKKKGLATVSEGLERPLVLSQKQPKSSEDQLVSQLQSIFQLERQNKEAQEIPNFSMKQAFGQR